MFRIVAATCLFGLLASPVAGQEVILVGGNILTGDPARPSAQAIALSGGRIHAVGSNEDIRRLAGPKTAVVELRGRTVISGLMDTHVHLLTAPSTIVDAASLREYEQNVLPEVLRGFIRHGITTIRSTADPLPYITELRDRLEKGAVSGPRLRVTGPTPSSPGGHPAVTVCGGNPFCRQTAAREITDQGRARQVVRELLGARVDAVKVTLENTIASVREVPLLSDEVVATLVSETHRGGRRIIAHLATDAVTSERLVRLGLDELVHMPVLRSPSERSGLGAALANRSVAVTTTLSIWDAYKDSVGGERLVWGIPYGPGLRQSFEAVLATTKVFADAGVKLVVGTDWINDADYGRQGNARNDDPRLLPGARTLHEMDLLRRAGLAPADVVIAATRTAAEALGILDQLGTLTAGKRADLVILDGDLLQDFSVLRRAVAVIKDGRVVSGALPSR